MQRGTLHTHLCLQPCLVSGWWAGACEELVPSLTLLMYSVPKDRLRELTGVPFACQSSPIQPAHPRVIPILQSNTLVILHAFSLHPVVLAGLSCPPCRALSTSTVCTTSPSTAVKSTPTLQPSGRQDLKDLLSHPWALPRISLQLLPVPGPLWCCCKSPFLGRSCSRALLCKSTKENYRRGLAAQSTLWSSSVCLGRASLLSWLAFHSAEERGSRPPSDGLSRAHVCGPQSSAKSLWGTPARGQGLFQPPHPKSKESPSFPAAR